MPLGEMVVRPSCGVSSLIEAQPLGNNCMSWLPFVAMTLVPSKVLALNVRWSNFTNTPGTETPLWATEATAEHTGRQKKYGKGHLNEYAIWIIDFGKNSAFHSLILSRHVPSNFALVFHEEIEEIQPILPRKCYQK